MLLQVEDGAMTKEFRVLGHADRVDESLKRSHASGTKVGGPASIPADFKPKITFVDENALKEGKDGDNGGKSKSKAKERASRMEHCSFDFYSSSLLQTGFIVFVDLIYLKHPKQVFFKPNKYFDTFTTL